MKYISPSIVFVFLILQANISFAADKKYKAEKIIKLLSQFDDLYRSTSSTATVEMVITTPNWTRTLQMNMWSQGTEKTFVRILKPRKDKGVATLKKGNEMWNFFPKINKVIKVPTSMMMGSWMGSDITNDDMVKEFRFSEDFDFSAKDVGSMIVVKLKPKEDTVSLWGEIELHLDAKTSTPTKEIFFDENLKKIRQINFKDLRQMNGRTIPFIMEIIPFNKPGNRTEIKYLKLDFETKIPDSVFSKKNLQKRI